MFTLVVLLYLKWGLSISALEHCRKINFIIHYTASSVTNRQYIKCCHASVNLDNVDVLYLENWNVDRPVLKNITATIFYLKKPFLVNITHL